MLYVKYFLLCGHLLRSSDLRFIRFLLMSILYFSHKHTLHAILPGLYGCACATNFHVSLQLMPPSLRSHIRFESSARFLCVRCLKEALWPAHPALNASPATPIYLCALPLYCTVAPYTTLSLRHLPPTGHADPSLQLHRRAWPVRFASPFPSTSLLCAPTKLSIFIMHEYDSPTVLPPKSLRRGCRDGKCRRTRPKNSSPMPAATFPLHGGLYHATRLWRPRFLSVAWGELLSGPHLKTSVHPAFSRTSPYSSPASRNSRPEPEMVASLSRTEAGMLFRTDGGWFEAPLTHEILPLGFL